MFTIIFVAKSLKRVDWNNVGPALQTVAQHYLIIDPMYRVIRVVAFQGGKCHPYGSQSRHGQSLNSVSMVGQRRIRLTGIEPAMGCDAGLTMNRYWVGALLHGCCPANTKHCITFVQRRPNVLDVGPPLYKCYTNVLCLLGWPAPAMVVEGIGLHVEDILVSLVLSIVLSWTFRILAHEDDQYTVMFTKY